MDARTLRIRLAVWRDTRSFGRAKDADEAPGSRNHSHNDEDETWRRTQINIVGHCRRHRRQCSHTTSAHICRVGRSVVVHFIMVLPPCPVCQCMCVMCVCLCGCPSDNKSTPADTMRAGIVGGDYKTRRRVATHCSDWASVPPPDETLTPPPHDTYIYIPYHAYNIRLIRAQQIPAQIKALAPILGLMAKANKARGCARRPNDAGTCQHDQHKKTKPKHLHEQQPYTRKMRSFTHTPMNEYTKKKSMTGTRAPACCIGAVERRQRLPAWSPIAKTAAPGVRVLVLAASWRVRRRARRRSRAHTNTIWTASRPATTAAHRVEEFFGTNWNNKSATVEPFLDGYHRERRTNSLLSSASAAAINIHELPCIHA